MNTKLLNGILLAGGLLVGGTAAAGTFTWTGSVADWALASASGGITSTDGDITFKYLSDSGTFSDLFNTANMVTLSEIEIGGIDYYDVGFNFSETLDAKYDGGGSILFSLTAHDLPIVNMLFDTIKVGEGNGLTATKELFDSGIATPFLTLTSTDGSNTGYTGFNPRSYIEVKDTFNTATGAAYQDSHNNFSIAPEPVPLSLFGIGLAALGFSRRHRTA